jgi:hypothetical protein
MAVISLIANGLAKNLTAARICKELKYTYSSYHLRGEVYVNAEISENDLLGKTEAVAEQAVEEDNPLHALQKAIAAMPAVDTEKVEAAINKLRQGQLGILGSDAERLASAQRIAAQIIEETSMAEETQTKNPKSD